jgi:hypothetical protein
VEVRIAEFEDAMEEQGYSEEEIERETAALREKMLAEELRAKEVATEARKLDTHQIAEKKAKELEKLASALGVGRDSRPGDSFNPEIQAERREREKMQRELEKKERHEAYLQREAARKERDERRRREDADYRCAEPHSAVQQPGSNRAVVVGLASHATPEGVTIATRIGRETIATNVDRETTTTARRVRAASKVVWLVGVGGHQTSAVAAAVILAAGMASVANARGAPKVVAGTAVSPTRNGRGPRPSRLQTILKIGMRRMAQLPPSQPRRRRRSQVCRSRTKGRGELQGRIAAAKMRKTGRRRGGADRAARRPPPRRPGRRPLTRRRLRRLPARRVKKKKRQGDNKNYSRLILREFPHSNRLSTP